MLMPGRISKRISNMRCKICLQLSHKLAVLISGLQKLSSPSVTCMKGNIQMRSLCLDELISSGKTSDGVKYDLINYGSNFNPAQNHKGDKIKINNPQINRFIEVFLYISSIPLLSFLLIAADKLGRTDLIRLFLGISITVAISSAIE